MTGRRKRGVIVTSATKSGTARIVIDAETEHFFAFSHSRGGYSVTHRGTGLRIWWVPTLEDAHVAMRVLEEQPINWRFTSPDGRPNEQQRTALFEALYEALPGSSYWVLMD